MMTAVVLAGGQKTGLDKEMGPSLCEALIPIGQRFMIEYVVDALRKSEYIGRIVIAGPMEELKAHLPPGLDIILAPNGETVIKSLLNALKTISPKEERILVVTADVPLLTTTAVDSFIESCRYKEGDFFYPIVSREANESKYPGVRRTYVSLKEGIFTGGNIFLVDPKIVAKCEPVAEELVRLRKNPLSLASYIGWGVLIRYALGMLSLKEAEEKVSSLLGIKGTGIISPFPEIGIDVDKISDLELVRKKLN